MVLSDHICTWGGVSSYLTTPVLELVCQVILRHLYLRWCVKGYLIIPVFILSLEGRIYFFGSERSLRSAEVVSLWVSGSVGPNNALELFLGVLVRGFLGALEHNADGPTDPH